MGRILLTGAAGMIGTVLADKMPKEGEIWRLTDLHSLAPRSENGVEVMQGDLTDPGFAKELCSGVEAIIHMAGEPRERRWPELVEPNVTCTFNLWQAAAEQGVERIIYGSSNHVLGMYPVSQKLGLDAPYRPDSRYGVTKMFGEAVARLYADKNNLKAFIIRIGSFLDRPTTRRHMRMWISHRDMCTLVRLGLTADYHCETVFGISNNTNANYDNSRAYELGYRPQDNGQDYAGDIPDDDLDPDSPIVTLQGGFSCGRDFSGDLSLLLGAPPLEKQ
nr:NAD(P)-dependent oxidoreductase [uncultured Cohaesibacter sp.]